MLLASAQANFGVNMSDFLAGTERVRKEVNNIKNLKATIEASIKVKAGAAATLRADVRRTVDNAVRGVAGEVGLRVKAKDVAKVKSDIKAAAGNVVAEVAVKVTPGGAAGIREVKKALNEIDKLPKGRREFELNVKLAAGTAAVFRALRAQFDSLDKKKTITIDVQINNGHLAMLQGLNSLLLQAAANARNLRSSLNGMGGAGAGGGGGSGGGFAGATRDAQDYNSVLGHLANTVRRFLVGYLGVKLLIDGMRALKESTIDYNASVIQTTNTLTRMLDGNRKLAISTVKDIQNFAERTPYRFQEVLPIVTQLKLAKIEAKGLVPALEALGNVAATTGNGAEGITRMANSIRDMNARGRITGEEVRELSRQAVPVYEYIAKSWKISTSQAQEYIRKGMIPAKQATDALLKNMAADPKFAKALEEQSKTLPGALSNIADVLQRTMGEATKSAYDGFTKFAVRVSKFVATKDFQTWAKQAVASVVAAFTMMGQAVMYVLGLVVRFRAVLLAAVAVMAARIIWMAVVAVGQLAVSFVQMTGRVIVFAATAIQGFRALNPWVQAAIVAIALYATNFMGLRDVVNNVIMGVLDQFQNLAVGAAWAIEQLAKLPGASAILGDQTGLAESIKNDWDEKIAASKKGLDNLSKMLDEQKAKAGSFFNTILNPLNITGLIDSWAKTAQNAADKVTKNMKVEIPNYQGQFTNGDDKGKKKAEQDRLRREKDILKDNAAAWAQYAKAVEEAAKRQIDAYRKLQGTVAEFFESQQKRLIELGALNDPLAPMIRSMEKLLGLGDKMKGIVAYTKAISTEAARVGLAAQKAVEQKSKLDGIVPGEGIGAVANQAIAKTSNVGLAIAKNAQRIQEKYGSNLESAFHKSCDRLADLTVRGVTSAYNRIMGPYSRGGITDSALKTMGRFQRAGIGMPVTPGMALAPGGLLYSSSLGHGSGHVQTIGTRGQRLDQYGANRFKLSNFQWYVPPPGTANVMAPGGRPAVAGIETGRLQKAFGVKPTLTNLAGGGLDEALGSGFSNALTGISAVPKAWGKAVRDTKESQARFMLQTQLTSDDFKARIDEIAKATLRIPESMEGARARVIKWFRDFANSADFLATRLQTIADAEKTVRDARRTVALAGHEGDPFAALDYDRRGEKNKATWMSRSKNPKLAAIGRRELEALGGERQSVRDSVVAPMIAATDKQLAQAKATADALRANVGLMGASQIQMAAYGRAVELTNVRLKIEGELYDQLNSKDQGVRLKAQTEAQRRYNQAASDYYTGIQNKAVEELNNARAASKQRIDQLNAEQRLLKNNSLNSTQVADRLEAQRKAQETFNTVYNAYVDTVGSSIAVILATASAQKDFQQSMDTSALERQNKAIAERKELVRQLGIQQETTKKQLGILGSTFAFDPAQARMQEAERLRSDIAARAANGEYGNFAHDGARNAFVQDRVDLGMKQYDLGTQTKNAEEMNKITSGAAEAMLTWKDATVTAGITFETVFGKFKNETDDVKKNLIESVRITDSLKYAADQLTDARSQAFDLQAQLEEKSITNGKEITELQKQQLKWKYADLEATARGLQLSDETKKKIQEARDEVAALLEKVDAQKPLDKIREETKSALESIHGIFADAFGKIYEDGFGSFFDNIALGFSKLLNDLASQILASYFLKLLVQLIPGVGPFLGKMGAGGNAVKDSVINGAVGAVTDVVRGSGGNGKSNNGQGGDSGPSPQLQTSPSENVTFNLMSTQQTAAQLLNSPTSAAMATRGLNSNGSGDTIYQYNIDRVEADSPAQFEGEVRRLADGTQAKKLSETVSYGNQKR